MSKYTDLNVTFNMSNNDSTSVLTDLEAIKQSLLRLFTTNKGSVPFNRGYGSSLSTLLFENKMDISEVSMFLYMDITACEPRISLNPADLIIRKVSNNAYEINVNFTVPSLNNTSGKVYTVINE